MINLLTTICFYVTSLLCYGIAVGQTVGQPLNVQTPGKLNFINVDGKLTSYYELYLTNSSTDTLKIKQLKILDGGDASIQLENKHQELLSHFSIIGSARKDTMMWLVSGQSAMIYVELSLVKKTVRGITHIISFEVVGNKKSGELRVQTLTTECTSGTQLALGNPLSNGFWAAVYNPTWERGHRKVVYTLNGETHIPGRYGIDFIKLDDAGKYAIGNEDSIKNWIGYEADVLAVADGVVSSTRDDFSESATLSNHAKYSADKATGNYISIKIGDSQFAFYEHLKPKSIKVKIGQKVKRGQVIASLGFTGQTTGPHLHFHVADKDSPLGAEGVPFVFRAFEAMGSYDDFGEFGKSRWEPLESSKQIVRTKELPSPNSVVKFKKE